MKCYFCHQEMISQKVNNDYVCGVCPQNLHGTSSSTNDEVQLMWIEISHNGRVYQPAWYINENKLYMFRIYSRDGRFEAVIELKEGLDNITPQNIQNKINTLLTFM